MTCNHLSLIVIEHTFSFQKAGDFPLKIRCFYRKNEEQTLAIWLRNLYTETTGGAKWSEVE